MNQTVHDDSCSSITCIKPGGTQNETNDEYKKKQKINKIKYARDIDAVTCIQFVTIIPNALNSACTSTYQGKNLVPGNISN